MAIPSDITGLRLWLKADALTGLVDGDPVTTWTDSSGNGFSPTQATAAKKPLYKTSILNGLPIVRFDGTDDALTGSTWTTVINTTGGGIYTFIALVRVASSAAGAVGSWDDACLTADGGGNVAFTGTRDVTGALTVRAYNFDGAASREDFADVTGVGYNAWRRIAQDHDNVTLRVNSDGGTFQTDASTSPFTSLAMMVGSNYNGAKFLAADVAEFCVWNKVLSGTEYADMAAYFDQKWITAAAPTVMGVHPRRMPLGV